MLYSSYGQRGLHWIYGQPKRLPTYPMRPPHLPTAAIYDLNDSPPNSLFKNTFEQPNSRRLATSLLPLRIRWMVGCGAGQSVPLPG